MNLADELARFDFIFPPELIGTTPASPRDSARLMVCRRDGAAPVDDMFAHLGEYLPTNAVLVCNETKVIPARLMVHKSTGGLVKLLVIGVEKNHVVALADKGLPNGTQMTADSRHSFIVEKKYGARYSLKPSFAVAKLQALLEKRGEMPIPPYIKGSPLTEAELRRRYQTVFAKTAGSVAAPTASLHFTKRLFAKLRRRGIDIHFVTLHVGLGTFAPLTETELSSGKLHREKYAIDRMTVRALENAKRDGRPIIAVGTTALRALESAANAKGSLAKPHGDTSLFIRKGYRFRFVDGIITNFHTPKSSLLMLVSAFAGRERIMAWYGRAIKKNYRLFSFGDGMLIL